MYNNHKHCLDRQIDRYFRQQIDIKIATLVAMQIDKICLSSPSTRVSPFIYRIYVILYARSNCSHISACRYCGKCFKFASYQLLLTFLYLALMCIAKPFGSFASNSHSLHLKLHFWSKTSNFSTASLNFSRIGKGRPNKNGSLGNHSTLLYFCHFQAISLNTLYCILLPHTRE